MAHSRIEPFLIDLNPQDVIKVFNLIENFTNLDAIEKNKVENFKNLLKSKEFTPLERYLILHYITEYFNTDNKRSQISKYILKLQKTKESEDIEEIEALDLKYRSLRYVQDIMDICNYSREPFKRKAISQLKTGKTIQLLESDLKLNDFFLMPLPFSYAPKRMITFKQKAFEIFGNIFSQEIITDIINNSFKTQEIEYKYMQLLNIQFENSTDINYSFFLFYKAYKVEVTHICKRIYRVIEKMNERTEQKHRLELKKVILLFEEKYPEKIEQIKKELNAEHRKEMEKQKEVIKSFLNKIKDFKKAQNKTNIARIMFMSFPQIRYNYSELKNNKEISAEEYLKIVSRNIRKKA
jgi:hypothetical protein